MSFLSTLQIIAGFGEAVGNALVCSAIHRRPSAAGLHWPDQYRGISIQSDCAEDAILVDLKSLALPNPNFHGAGASEEMGFVEALREADPLEQAARFRQQVKGWIRAALPVGNCRLELLASRLNCDKRTLQRRLDRQVGLQFSGLGQRVPRRINFSNAGEPGISD